MRMTGFLPCFRIYKTSKRGLSDEKNIPAQEKTEKQGSRIQKENGFHRGKKGFKEKKKQRQKKAFGIKGEISQIKEKRRLSKAVYEGKKSIFPLYNVGVFFFG